MVRKPTNFTEVDIEKVKVDIKNAEVNIESEKVDIRSKLLAFSKYNFRKNSFIHEYIGMKSKLSEGH